jgi:hypothetical protein
MRTSARSHQKSSLQLRLRAWDDVASQAVSRRTDRGSRNWLLYTTAVGSALAMATDAGAQIIDYGGTLPAVTLNAGQGYPKYGSIFTVAGKVAFDLAGVDFASGGIVVLEAFGKVGMLVNASSGVQKLAFGATISAGAGTFVAGPHAVKSVSGPLTYGTFSASQPRFAGIKFNTGANTSSATINDPTKIHYGWIELVYDGTPDPTSITAIDWAYNEAAGQEITAGEITAGETGAPEPGTAALSLLAMGAAGVLAWRRRKAALTAE